MQDFPLTIGMILRHGHTVYGDSEVVTFEGDGSRRATFAEVAGRAERLAGALQRLGIETGDRVGTFQWNNQEHLEGYLAIPTMGAVLHTLNIRLFPELLTYVVNHAEDRIVIVDDSLVPLLARVAPDLKTVEHFIVVGSGDASALADAAAGVDVLRYEELLAAEDAEFPWPDVDERAAAAMCYTSGTTGNPKGVVYSHRSTVLHSMSVNAGYRRRAHRARSGAADRADVPRQRVGTAVRGVVRGRGLRDAGPVPPGRTAREAHRIGAAHRRRRGADHLVRPAPLLAGASGRHELLPARRVRRVGGARAA